MRIISKTKDYWDYIPKMYDPAQDSKLVYHRKSELSNSSKTCSDLDNKDLLRKIRSTTSTFYRRTEIDVITIFFAGKIYYCLCCELEVDAKYFFYTIDDLVNHFKDRKIKYLSEELSRRYTHGAKKGRYRYQLHQGKAMPEAILWNRDLVCSSIDQYGNFTKDIILNDLNFSQMFSPEQAFQEFNTHFSSLMNLEEMKDHDILDDRSKILAKGMDLKRSFRHRK